MTANFTGSEMILKQSKNPKKRSWKNGHEKPFFAKNIEKLSSNSDFLPLTSYKIGKKHRIMLYKVWYVSRAKKSCQNFRSGWNSRSPSKSQNLVSTWLETVIVQGVSLWNWIFKLALRDRRTNIFFDLWCLVASGGADICVSSTIFQKKWHWLASVGWLRLCTVLSNWKIDGRHKIFLGRIMKYHIEF